MDDPLFSKPEGIDQRKDHRAHELAMHAAYKQSGNAEDIAAAYNTAYKIVMEAGNG